MKLKKSDIQEAYKECEEKYPFNDVHNKGIIANDFFFNGVNFAQGEAQHVIDRCNQNNAENVSFAVGEAEKEQDEKYRDKLLMLAADYHKAGQHSSGHVVEYVIDYLF